MWLLIKLLVVLAALYAMIALAAWLFQRKLMYRPWGGAVTPQSVGLDDVVPVRITTGDGLQLTAWYLKPRPGQPVLLYFHGNGGSLGLRATRFHVFRQAGIGCLMFSYRGYSGNPGHPTEADNVRDGLAAFDWLLAAGMAPRDIFIYGVSLGAAVAVQVAVNRPQAAGLIMEAPFISAVAIGQQRYPFLPVNAFMRDRYESITHIRRLKIPLLLLHGDEDQVIPVSHGQALLAAAPERNGDQLLSKTGVFYLEGDHLDLYDHGAFEDILTFIEGEHPTDSDARAADVRN